MNHFTLQKYYSDYFPFDLLYKFLQNTPNREYTITLQNNIYVRALSFKSAYEFKSYINKKVPAKIDIGAIYKSIPEQGTEMTPLKKELVFDIDLTDYYRICCEGKNICDKCFVLIKCAIEIMEHILKAYFGYKNILYVFSGGRGLHIWVLDVNAQYLNDRERNYIVEMITNFKLDNNLVSICKKYTNYFYDQNINGIVDEKLIQKYLYVKLDKKVTSDIKHLLKSPFAVHPTSFKISVPLDIDNLENLKVENFITVDDILENPNVFTQYVDFFSRFVK